VARPRGKPDRSRLFLSYPGGEAGGDWHDAHLAQSKENLDWTFGRIPQAEINALAKALLGARKVWIIGFRSTRRASNRAPAAGRNGVGMTHGCRAEDPPGMERSLPASALVRLSPASSAPQPYCGRSTHNMDHRVAAGKTEKRRCEVDSACVIEPDSALRPEAAFTPIGV
jgi:hypothetical protein